MHRKFVWVSIVLLLLAMMSVLPAAAQGGSGNLTLSCDGDTVRADWTLDARTLPGQVGVLTGPGYGLGLTTFSGSVLTPFSNTTVTLELWDGPFEFVLDSETITCGTPPVVTPPGDCPYVRDGRINDCNLDKIAIYPVQDANGSYGLEIWLVDGLSFELRELVISAEELAKYPEKPAENVQIAEALNGLIKVFKLTSGEYQVDYGPDADGKVFSFFFKHFQPGAYYMEITTGASSARKAGEHPLD